MRCFVCSSAFSTLFFQNFLSTKVILRLFTYICFYLPKNEEKKKKTPHKDSKPWVNSTFHKENCIVRYLLLTILIWFTETFVCSGAFSCPETIANAKPFERVYVHAQITQVFHCLHNNKNQMKCLLVCTWSVKIWLEKW